MSGLGGGGATVLYRAREDRYEVIDYGMRAPASLRLEEYPLTGGGAASDIFPWPRVKDDRNIHGPGSIAVPGVVAGMEEAHRRHAKLPWKELLAPSANWRRASLPTCSPLAARYRLQTSSRSARICVSRWRFPIAAARCSRHQNSPRGQRFHARSVCCRTVSSPRVADRMRRPTSP